MRYHTETNTSHANSAFIGHCTCYPRCRHRTVTVAAILTITTALCAYAQTSVWCVVDEHIGPLPGAPPAGRFYNQVGGDFGKLSDSSTDPAGVAVFSRPRESVYRAEASRHFGLWGAFGMWYAVGGPIADKPGFDPAGIYHPAILPQYQPRLTGIDVVVDSIASPAGRNDLEFRIELKGFTQQDSEVRRRSWSWSGRSNLTTGPFPKFFSADVDPAALNGPVGVVLWTLDRAVTGDAIEVDAVRLRLAMPELAVADRAFLTSLGLLLGNYDDNTGMVQDRSNFPSGDFENVTATAKLAKILAMAIEIGFVEETAATDIIVTIADTLLNTVPRGPGGINALWPHFTRNGGAERIADSEWASGDTAYAILDLIVALQMVGDPGDQLAAALAMLRQIDWAALQAPSGGFYHGYDTDGRLLPGIWYGFGTETLGVLLASLAGDGPLGMMGPPLSDNGSGFIHHAGYPFVPAGVDRWGNNWLALRREEVELQLDWYSRPEHANPYIVARQWFGLSAAERPEGWHADPARIYQAYGTGGQYAPANDGSNRVVVLHYSGMVASLARDAAETMWAGLEELGIISPLQNMESMAINPTNGAIEQVNHLRGSWNLALQAEGWALCHAEAASAIDDAVRAVPPLRCAYNVLFPTANGPSDVSAYDTHMDRFLRNSGVCLPWIRYGWDLGKNPWGGAPGGYAHNRAALEEDFAYLDAHHVKLCRVFLFCDFRTGLEYDANGRILGVDAYVYDDMQTLIDVASSNDLRLIVTLMDFGLADGVQWERSSRVGEHPDFITNTVQRTHLIDNVIRPFVRHFGTNDAIHAWDVMNEPRFATAVPQPQMRDFIEACAEAILDERPGANVCFGGYDRYHLDDYGNMASTMTQVHYYEHMAGYWNFDTPSSEIYSNDVFFGEVSPYNLVSKLETAASNGYSGVLFWSLNGNDGHDFSEAAADYRDWVAAQYAHINSDLAVEALRVADTGVDLRAAPTYPDRSYRVSCATNLLKDTWRPILEFTGCTGTNVTDVCLPRVDGTPFFVRIEADL